MNFKLRINTPHIVYDTIEEETIMINLKNGNYYNLDKNGTIVWDIIEKGGDIEIYIRTITKIFNLPAEQTKKDIEIFISSLIMENLLVPLPSDVVVNSSFTQEAIEVLIRKKLPSYIIPLVNKYSDMRDALMLDPIHEVDERGWPTMNEDLFYREHEDVDENSNLNDIK
jgi:hypothetical protein